MRRRVFKGAKVVYPDWSTIDCIIRHMSETGVQLDFNALAPLPDSFQLLLVSENRLIPAVRIWQRGLSAGVKFTGPDIPAPPRKL